MEQLAQDILLALQHMPDVNKKKRIEDFAHLFFNRRSKGNHALMLGISDSLLVKDILSITAEEIINDNKTYLIRIKRVRPRDDKIVLRFNSLDRDLSFDESEKIKSLFEFYKQADTVNLDLAFKNRSIPNLEIKGNIISFLDNKHPSIATLSGENRFSSVTIWTSNKDNNDVVSTIDDLLILPRSYSLLANNSTENSNVKDFSHYISFWNEFEKNEQDNCSIFNFVILNNINDHLLRIFAELLARYKARFNINDEDMHLLRRVFYLFGNLDLSQSRFLDGVLPDNKDFLMSLTNDLKSINTSIKDVELYSGFLNIISKFHKADDVESISKFGDTVKNTLTSFDKIVSGAISDVVEDFNSIPAQYRNLVLTGDTLRQMLESREANRERFFISLEECYRALIPFAEKYNPTLLPEIIQNKERCEKAKENYLRKAKFLLKSRYYVGEKDFKVYISQEIENVSNIISSKIICKISPESWSDISRIADFQEQLLGKIRDQGTSLIQPMNKIYEYGVLSATINSIISKIISDFSIVKDTICYSSISEGKTIGQLENIKKEWEQSFNEISASVFADTSTNDFLMQEKSEEEIRYILLKKMNLILSSI